MPCRLIRALAVAAILAILPAASAKAVMVLELGDAGALPSSAQFTGGTDVSPLTSITGTISSTTDRDMYLIFIDGGSIFSATTASQPGTLVDTQLFLFDLSGRGVYANDDDPNGFGINSLRSTLPAGNALTPVSAGLYYLLIANAGSFPTGAGGVIFPNYTSSPSLATAVVGPTGAGGSSPITGYATQGNVETGTYTIALTGARVASAVPEPTALLWLGLATPGLIALARRRPTRSAVVELRAD